MTEQKNEEQPQTEAAVAPEVWNSELFLPLVEGGLLRCGNGQFTLTFTGNAVSGSHSHPSAHDVVGSTHENAGRRVIVLRETGGGGQTHRALLIPGTPDRFVGRWRGQLDSACSALAISGSALDQGEAIWVATKGG